MGRLPLLATLVPALWCPLLRAQLVRGSLVDKATGQAIDGAFVALLDQGQAEVARALTNSEGAFLLRSSAPGMYRLRFKRIGFQPAETPPFPLEDGETLAYRLEVDAVPVRLSAITVRGRPRCGSRGDRDAALAQLWEEAREALAAVKWTEDQAALRYTVERFERQFPRTGRLVLAERHIDYTGTGEKPFRSIPAEDLVLHGYVVPKPGDIVDYYAPDADVLLGDQFLDTHCFSARDGGFEHPGLVGLAFEPEPGRKLPDVVGVLWLERQTLHLRFLEYSYTIPRDHSLGGQLGFAPLPSGQWIVKDWWIRTARADTVGRGDVFRRRFPRLVGFRETGGIVSTINSPTGDVLYSGTPTLLEGTVVDASRAEAPLADAVVLLGGSDRAATTDDRGRFQIRGALDGNYRISFRHPRLDSLGIDPDERVVNLVRGARHTITLSVPGDSVVIARLCPGPSAQGRRVIVGAVRDSSFGVIADAQVLLQLEGKAPRVVAATSRAGRYVICDVPTTRFTLWASAGRVASPEIVLEFGSGGVRVDGTTFHAMYGSVWTQDFHLLRSLVPSARRATITFLVIGAACTASPAVVLAPVPAGWVFGSLECVGRLLEDRGYEVRVSPRDAYTLEAERGEGTLGTGAHRERIQVLLVADTTGALLRTSVWAVDYAEAGASLRQTATINAPSKQTVADADEAVHRCARQ